MGQIHKKIMTKSFSNFKELYFWAILSHFGANLAAPSRTTSYRFLKPFTKFRKN